MTCHFTKKSRRSAKKQRKGEISLEKEFKTSKTSKLNLASGKYHLVRRPRNYTNVKKKR